MPWMGGHGTMGGSSSGPDFFGERASCSYPTEVTGHPPGGQSGLYFTNTNYCGPMPGLPVAHPVRPSMLYSHSAPVDVRAPGPIMSMGGGVWEGGPSGDVLGLPTPPEIGRAHV